MFGIDWANLQVYHYIAIGGGVLTVLALVLHFVLPAGFKVPAGVLGTIAGFVTGIALGVIGMAGFGYHLDPTALASGPNTGGAPPPGMGEGKGFGAPKGMPGGFGGPPGFGGGEGKGKGKGPSPKAQLATLVTKLQQLTGKPLALSLSAAQRLAISEQIKGLDTADELDDEDAKTRLEAILDAVKDERPTLEAVGYRFPNAGGSFQIPGPVANPFREAENQKRLAALQANLAAK